MKGDRGSRQISKWPALSGPRNKKQDRFPFLLELSCMKKKTGRFVMKTKLPACYRLPSTQCAFPDHVIVFVVEAFDEDFDGSFGISLLSPLPNTNSSVEETTLDTRQLASITDDLEGT